MDNLMNGITNTFIYTQSSIIKFESLEHMMRCKDELMCLSTKNQNGEASKLNFDKINDTHAFVYGNFERYAVSMFGEKLNAVLHIGEVIQKYASDEFQVTYRSIRNKCIHEVINHISPDSYKWKNVSNSFDVCEELPSLSIQQYSDICSNIQTFYKFTSFFAK